jgi:hypothetical protein
VPDILLHVGQAVPDILLHVGQAVPDILLHVGQAVPDISQHVVPDIAWSKMLDKQLFRIVAKCQAQPDLLVLIDSQTLLAKPNVRHSLTYSF